MIIVIMIIRIAKNIPASLDHDFQNALKVAKASATHKARINN